MPEINRFFGIIIKYTFKTINHHIFTLNMVMIKRNTPAIETLEILAGKLPKRANAMVV